MDAIAQTLAVLVGENYVNRFNYFDRSYDVIPQVRQQDRLTPDSLGRFYVRARNGALIPLSTVVSIDIQPAANRLPQFNQMNAATLSGVLAPGVTMGEAVKAMAAQKLAPGASIDWLSDSRQYVTEGDRLTVSFGFALIVIFLVLAAQFESVRDPLVILVTVPARNQRRAAAALCRIRHAQHLHPDRPRHADRSDIQARHPDGVVRQRYPARRGCVQGSSHPAIGQGANAADS